MSEVNIPILIFLFSPIRLLLVLMRS